MIAVRTTSASGGVLAMSETISQLLDVIEGVRSRFRAGNDDLRALSDARIEATNKVAEDRHVCSETVRDKYVRGLRPALDSTKSFDKALWSCLAKGSCDTLQDALLAHADSEDRKRIDQFFADTVVKDVPDERMSAEGTRFEPAIDIGPSGSNILLRSGKAEATINGSVFSGAGEVWLNLAPHANIRFRGEFQGVPPADALQSAVNPETTSSFSFEGREVEGFSLGAGGDVQAGRLRAEWCPKSEPITGIGDSSTRLARVVFHLFNFSDFIGTERSFELKGITNHAIEHLVLASKNWRVRLRSLLVTRENIETVKKEGGYRFTHLGCLERIDGAQFSVKEAGDQLHAIRFFLSFARGGWVQPVCPVGFAPAGRVWESWSSPNEGRYTYSSWFDRHHASELETLFPGFMDRWEDDDWREALQEVIYWYLNANDSARGVDAGIILTQAAIERLSYEFSVKDRRLITADGFKGLPASDKFRLLFSSVGVPLDIPAESAELRRLAGQMRWTDAPHALTDIRNSLVHPEHKRRGHLNSAYSEAWNQGQWCLEMGILAICKYSGTYGNRLREHWVGEVQDVPWKR